MKLPIPSDWSGDQWRCIEIEWPDSPYWLAMLNGWLSQFKRGRLWDESTGDLLAVMLVGAEIWYRNQALTSCDGSPTPTPDPEIVYKYISAGGCPGDCEEDMPCLDLTSLLKIEGGKLYARNSCCEWEVIGALAGADNVEQPPDDPFTPPGEEPPTFYACGKATAAATIVRDVATAIWEQFDSYPWQWVPKVEQDVGLDLDNQSIILGVMQSIEMEALGYTYEEVVNDAVISWLKCQLVTKFSDNADRATEDDWKSARSLMRGHSAFDPFLANFWDYVFYAIGWQHFANAAQMGAITEGDCTGCEDVINPPEMGAVYWTGGINNAWKPPETNNAVLTLNGQRSIASISQSGVTGLAYTDQQFTIGIASTEKLTSLTLRFRGNTPTNDWHNPAVPDLTDLQRGVVLGVTGLSTSIVGGSVGEGFIDVKYDFSSAFPVGFGWPDSSNSCRHNPQTTANGWSSSFSIEIQAWA